MAEAAEIGTRKVIAEHATIGVVVTTDGSVTDLPRQAYQEAEARVDSQMAAEARNARATHAVNTDQPIEKTRAVLEGLYRAALKKAE